MTCKAMEQKLYLFYVNGLQTDSLWLYPIYLNNAIQGYKNGYNTEDVTYKEWQNMKAKHHPNLFKNRYPELQGSDWIKRIDPEDKKVFVSLGMSHNGYGRKGGLQRGKFGLRDKRGRFTKLVTENP